MYFPRHFLVPPNSTPVLILEQSRHPLVADRMGSNAVSSFVPNDITLGGEEAPAVLLTVSASSPRRNPSRNIAFRQTMVSQPDHLLTYDRPVPCVDWRGCVCPGTEHGRQIDSTAPNMLGRHSCTDRLPRTSSQMRPQPCRPNLHQNWGS